MGLRDVFARNLRRLRNAKGFSQEELASRASISREYLGSLERSRYAASIDVIEGLATALQVDPAHLFERTRSGRS
jgi:transcriptional regulator with XRE-family HTH domain